MSPTAPKPRTPSLQTPPATRREERVLDSAELLAGAERVFIEHRGERYALRATRAGKLIMTK